MILRRSLEVKLLEIFAQQQYEMNVFPNCCRIISFLVSCGSVWLCKEDFKTPNICLQSIIDSFSVASMELPIVDGVDDVNGRRGQILVLYKGPRIHPSAFNNFQLLISSLRNRKTIALFIKIIAILLNKFRSKPGQLQKSHPCSSEAHFDSKCSCIL